MRILLALCTAAIVAGCATTDSTRSGPALDKAAKWVLLPIANHTETPQAGLRAEAIAEALLRAKGVAQLARYPSGLGADSLVEPREQKVQEAAQKWAREQGARYALYGAVDEWRYKVGIDGEPAVGLALHVVDLASGSVLWSGVGGKSGWSRESLAGVAQKLMRDLLGSARIE